MPQNEAFQVVTISFRKFSFSVTDRQKKFGRTGLNHRWEGNWCSCFCCSSLTAFGLRARARIIRSLSPRARACLSVRARVCLAESELGSFDRFPPYSSLLLRLGPIVLSAKREASNIIQNVCK